MRPILILLLIYMVYRTFMKYVLPELMRGAINNAQERMRQQQQEMNARTEIKTPPKEDKTIKGGDYIDYEEVK
ncbi:MAG: hypothetical protein M0D57_20745 [Sphingobacteriales bacterium JAD_PAG50586_3]|nr:MAG: hypothetical protein M0D57_20745 [Sphingobacteriales bacterium JAD_PAG50586_3]